MVDSTAFSNLPGGQFTPESSGQFDPKWGGQFCPEQVVSLNRIGVVSFTEFSMLGDVSLLTSRWELSFENYGFKNLIYFIQDQFLNLTNKKGEFKNWDDIQCNALISWIFSQITIIEECFYRFENSDYAFAADMYTCFELLKNNADLSKVAHLIQG